MAFKFQNFDFLHLDSNFSEGELLVRRTARDFVEDNIVPIIEECFREGRFPRELVPLMGEMGFFGATIDGYGCAGMSNVEYGLVMQELERGDSGLRSFVSVQSALVMYPIHAFGSDEQKNNWLPALASGKKLACFGLTEPGFGSNPGGMTTRARKSGDEYILNGEKMWITSGTISDVAVIWAKLEGEGELGNDSIRGFLVETNRPLMCLNQARYGISWGAIGAAMDCYSTALQYAKLRKQFHDQPIASHQIVQEKLVWMASEISKAQLLALHVGRLKDAGTVGHQHISMAKRNNVSMALECARLARDILGANGVTDDYPIMRHMMNLESVKTYEGTHDIHTLILGQHLTGIAAY
jgi:glutaryl-CoA dehydrogenase